MRLPRGVSQGPEKFQAAEPEPEARSVLCRRGRLAPCEPLGECQLLPHAEGTLTSLSSAAIWCRSPGEDAARQGSGAVLLGPSCSLCSGLSLTGLWSPRVAAKCGMIVPGPLWWRGSQRKVSPLMRWVAFQRLDAFRRRLSRWFSKCVEGRSSVLTFLGAGGVGQSVARTCVSVPLALESVPPAGGEGSGDGVREPWATAAALPSALAGEPVPPPESGRAERRRPIPPRGKVQVSEAPLRVWTPGPRLSSRSLRSDRSAGPSGRGL